jgi:hypothetical protein
MWELDETRALVGLLISLGRLDLEVRISSEMISHFVHKEMVRINQNERRLLETRGISGCRCLCQYA